MTKESVRESRDEELIADIISFMVSEPRPSSRVEFIDDYFGLSEDDASAKRYDQIEAAVQRRTPELVITDFMRTFDELIYVISLSDKNFVQLIFDENLARAPRYFQLLFLAFYELIVRQQKTPGDKPGLVQKLSGSGKQMSVPEGGRWGAEQRVDSVNALVGILSQYFIDDKSIDPAIVHWISQLQNILSQSYTEQSSYDFKQGFLMLDGSNKFDEDSFDKILKTCVGIANIRRNSRGYILVGVADKAATAARVETLFGVSPRKYDRFFITGVEHEAAAVGKTLDQFFQMIVDKIKHSKVSDDLRGFLTRNLKPVRYYNQTVFIFEINGQNDPSNFDGVYYDRSGAQLEQVKTTDVIGLVRRFV